MKRRLMSQAVLLLALALLPPGAAAQDLDQADRLYEKGGLDNCRAAIELYLQALARQPQSFELNWKSARAIRRYGELSKKQQLEGWKNICAEYGRKGMQYAQAAIDLEPGQPHGHYYYGLSAGTYSDGVSILTALTEGLKGKTQSGFERAYELDRNYDEGGPMLALGRFWAVLPWPLYNKKKALALYREFQASPFFAASDEGRIYLAELLIDLGDQEGKAEARALLEQAGNSGDAYFRDWARRLLSETAW